MIINMERLDQLFNHLNNAIENKIFPGCSIAIWKNGEEKYISHGRLTYDHTSPPVTPHTYYDLASLTKPLVTSLITLYLCDKKQLQLETPLKYLLGKRAGKLADITVKQLLSHSSGLSAHLNLHTLLGDINPSQRKDACIDLISSLSLDAPVPTYSDLGFILLGILLEDISGIPLHMFFKEKICPELKTDQLFFIPISRNGIHNAFNTPEGFAPTGYCPVRKTMIAAQVNDLNAWWLGGVAGHAGIFGNTIGLLQALVRLLKIYQGEETSHFLPIHWLKRFFTPVAGPHTRALGFDTPSPNSSSGRHFSQNTVGHLGWTGVSFWMDLTRQVIIIFLCNRPFPKADNIENLDAMRKFRPIIHNLLWEIFV